MYRINLLRTENQLSQAKLAEKIGSSQKAVDYWEKGASDPTAKFVIAMANCFGCSADYLLGREDDFGNVNIESDLSADEKALLYYFRSISKEQKHQLLQFAKFLDSEN